MIFKCSIAFLILFATSLRADTTEPDVRFTGRWVLEKHEAPWCAWQGSSFLAAFEGSGVFAELESDAVEYLRVIVDGDHVNSKKLKLKPGKHEYVLAQKLGHGKHLVEVVKETYAHRGKLRLHGVSAEGGKLLPVENEEQRIRIQFYGDSNLSGHSLGHEKNEGAPEFADVTSHLQASHPVCLTPSTRIFPSAVLRFLGNRIQFSHLWVRMITTKTSQVGISHASLSTLWC